MGFGLNPAVLVIDMTYAYFDPKSHLGYGAEAGWKAIASLRSLLATARKIDVPVVYTKSASIRLKRPELRGLGRKHAELPKSWNDPRLNTIVAEIEPEENDLVIDKFRASVFFGTPLVSYLIYHRIDTLILTGTSTSGCVRTSAADASSYGYHVIIPEECVFDREPLWHEVTLAVLGQKYSDMVPVEEVKSYLRRLKAPARKQVEEVL
jgi:nicotinamidase-related amidase